MFIEIVMLTNHILSFPMGSHHPTSLICSLCLIVSLCKQQRKRLKRWRPSPSKRSLKILAWRSSSKPWVPSSQTRLTPVQSTNCSRPCKTKTSRNKDDCFFNIYLCGIFKCCVFKIATVIFMLVVTVFLTVPSCSFR